MMSWMTTNTANAATSTANAQSPRRSQGSAHAFFSLYAIDLGEARALGPFLFRLAVIVIHLRLVSSLLPDRSLGLPATGIWNRHSVFLFCTIS
jgi:hypothetical protein